MKKEEILEIIKNLKNKAEIKKEFLSLLIEIFDLRENPFHPLVFINGEPKIGENVYIGLFSEINAKDGEVIIEDNCDIASFVSINVADSHRLCIGLDIKIKREPIIIEHNVFIGSHSFISGDTHVGHHSVIGAGTILINAGYIPPYSLIIGNPAKIKKGYYIGEPMKEIIPHNKPTLGKEEISAIEEVMKNGWIAEGKKVEEFEEEFCKYIGLPPFHAVALSNGTSALYLALKVLGVKIGDEVIAPTYVCSAVLNAIYMVGARPVLTDVEKRDFNISYQDIIGKISNKTKSIIVPHTFGVPADITLIRKSGIPIIEDCAVALGSKIGNQHVGVFGNIAIFSFYASKVITTGYGGMLISKNPEYVEKAKDYREFDCRKVYYPRFNFQMSDIQAAMGLQQLKKLNIFLNKRRRIAENYIDICKNKSWDFQTTKNNHYLQNWYRFVLKLKNNKVIKKLKFHLSKHGIETIIPIESWELLHNYLKFNSNTFKNAEKIAQITLSLPIYPKLIDDNHLERILKSLKEF